MPATIGIAMPRQAAEEGTTRLRFLSCERQELRSSRAASIVARAFWHSAFRKHLNGHEFSLKNTLVLIVNLRHIAKDIMEALSRRAFVQPFGG